MTESQRIAVHRIAAGIVVCLLVLVAAFGTAFGPLDGDDASSRTKYKLALMAESMKALDFLGEKTEFHSFDEFLAAAAHKGLIEADDYAEGRFSVDDWGMPFLFAVERQGNVTVTRITSCGRDEIFDGGRGDDITLSICKDGDVVKSKIDSPY